jgi:hypothetical protein
MPVAGWETIMPIRALVLTCVFALAFGVVGHGAGHAAEAQGLIAVLDLQGVDARDAETFALSERLREVLLKTGRYTLVDRSQMEAVLNEQALQQSGCTEQECALQVGRILGVRSIVVGKVVKISETVWLVSAMMIDVESARTLAVESIRHKGDYFTLLDKEIVRMGERFTDRPPQSQNRAATPAAVVTASRGTGSLFIASTPTGAEIVLDGAPQSSRTDVLLELVPVGPHSVVVKKGPLSTVRSVTVEPDRVSQLDLQLASQAIIEIRSTPYKADVVMDGVTVGRTPVTLETSVGKHELEIRIAGFVPARRELDLDAGRIHRIDAKMRAAGPEWQAYENEYQSWELWRGLTGIAAGGLVVGGLAASGNDECRILGSTHNCSSLSALSYGLGAVALGVVWWLNNHEPTPPDVQQSRIEISAANTPISGSQVAFSWRW